MNDLPQLSRRDLEDALEKLYKTDRRHHLFAFYGRGEEERIHVPGVGEVFVVPAESELDLREKLARFDGPGARAAFLLPFHTEVPVDLQGLFAHGGKIRRIGAEARIRRMFGVSEIGEGVARSPLARYLLETTPDATFRSASGRLDEWGLFEAWLARELGFEGAGGLGLDTLLAFAASDARGPEFVARVARPVAAGVREALLALLDGRFGPAAKRAWLAWERGEGAAFFEAAILCEELAETEDPAVRMWLRLLLKDAGGVDDPAEAQRVAKEVAVAVSSALALLERRSDASLAARLVHRAEARVDEPAVRAALLGHPRLPMAWQDRLDALGRILERAATAPSAEALAGASRAFEALETHVYFKRQDQKLTLERAEMAVRLLAFLAARPFPAPAQQNAAWVEAIELGGWYAAEGGYVDWARQFARGAALSTFDRGVDAIVRAVDDVRLDLDRRFAEGLASWVENGRPSQAALPIDHALDRIGARFLEKEASRRLLVLLLDGMAWAQAVELLQALGDRTQSWGPVGWNGKLGIGRRGVVPVFATLPTITDVSRAAFFGGKAFAPGEPTSTAKDPERFAAHAALRKRLSSNEVPKLLLRAEGHMAHGAASTEALTLVGDTSRRVVGIVVNAIDAALKRDPQQHARWNPETIRSLADLLEAARQADRFVLLCSDHGHVPSDLLRKTGESSGQGGARFRPFEGEGDVLAPGERKLEGPGVWAPRGKKAVVVLTDDRSRYGAAPTAGEHGGATLAEVVAPCVLLGCASGRTESGNDAERVLRAPVPDWWLLDVRAERDSGVLGATPKPSRKKKPEPDTNQLVLLPTEAPAPPPSPGPPSVTSLADHPLARSELFNSLAPQKDREKVLRAVDFLLARNGTASADAFAAAMGELAYRVRGLVSNLQAILNVDGYQVLYFDEAGKQVKLSRDKLAQQFEVTL